MSACVSPPQPRVSCMVQTAASMAQAASTAFPPFRKVIAPAVAPSGFPVMATQCFPWRMGFVVRSSEVRAADRTKRMTSMKGKNFPDKAKTSFPVSISPPL